MIKTDWDPATRFICPTATTSTLKPRQICLFSKEIYLVTDQGNPLLNQIVVTRRHLTGMREEVLRGDQRRQVTVLNLLTGGVRLKTNRLRENLSRK